MSRKEIFEKELIAAERELDFSLSQIGVNWAWSKFNCGCDKAESKPTFTPILFNKEAPSFARLVILESIKIDNMAKKEVIIEHEKHNN